jgi:hypothetical protein
MGLVTSLANPHREKRKVTRQKEPRNVRAMVAGGVVKLDWGAGTAELAGVSMMRGVVKEH